MSGTAPVVWLLSGLPGSGKTTFATALENSGIAVRLSVDEEMRARHGRLGKDYPEQDHLALMAPVIERVRHRLVALIRAGHSVVLDHGLGTRAERDDHKRLVTANGATWRLVHFDVAHGELLRRLALRNTDPDHGTITPDTLAWLARHSEAPNSEGEEEPTLPPLSSPD